MAKPSFTLTATDGQPFDFKARTAGKLTLLFFGYTNCPDVCPVHAANIAAVLRTLSWDDRQKVTFVFVTTDPDRDSLPAIRAWLDHFDSSFVGLHGTREQVDAIERQIAFPPAMLGDKRADGTYEVGHSSLVVAFEGDGFARVGHIATPEGLKEGFQLE